MSTEVCKKCAHFDPQYRTIQGELVELVYGWCGLKSVYPHLRESGQAFPPDCKRAEEGEIAKPIIVYGNKVELNCLSFVGK